ncbi:hypothetical protein J6590_056639 [Homalodisca vitripennis]|nr:hypothetical protein J6590_056639 [Homalodisca vitripennis]
MPLSRGCASDLSASHALPTTPHYSSPCPPALCALYRSDGDYTLTPRHHVLQHVTKLPPHGRPAPRGRAHRKLSRGLCCRGISATGGVEKGHV